MAAQRIAAQFRADTRFQEHGVGNTVIRDIRNHHAAGSIIGHGIGTWLIGLFDDNRHTVNAFLDTDLLHQITLGTQGPSGEVIRSPACNPVAHSHRVDIQKFAVFHIIGIPIPRTPRHRDGSRAISKINIPALAGEGQFICGCKIASVNAVLFKRRNRDFIKLQFYCLTVLCGFHRLQQSGIQFDVACTGLDGHILSGIPQSRHRIRRKRNRNTAAGGTACINDNGIRNIHSIAIGHNGISADGDAISADLGLNSGGAVCRDFHVHSFCQRITAFLRGSDRYGSFALSNSSNCARIANCCDSSIAALIGERPTGIAGDLGSDGLGSGLEQGHLICIHREGRLNRDSF